MKIYQILSISLTLLLKNINNYSKLFGLPIPILKSSVFGLQPVGEHEFDSLPIVAKLLSNESYPKIPFISPPFIGNSLLYFQLTDETVSFDTSCLLKHC